MAFPSTIHLSPYSGSTNISLSNIGDYFISKTANVSLAADIGSPYWDVGAQRWTGSPTTNGFWSVVTSNPYKMSSYNGYYRRPLGTIYGASYTLPYADSYYRIHPDWTYGDKLYGYCSVGYYTINGMNFNITFGSYNTGQALFDYNGKKYRLTQFIYNITKKQGMIRIAPWSWSLGQVADSIFNNEFHAYANTNTFYTITNTGATTDADATWTDGSTWMTYISSSNTSLDSQTTVLWDLI